MMCVFGISTSACSTQDGCSGVFPLLLLLAAANTPNVMMCFFSPDTQLYRASDHALQYNTHSSLSFSQSLTRFKMTITRRPWDLSSRVAGTDGGPSSAPPPAPPSDMASRCCLFSPKPFQQTYKLESCESQALVNSTRHSAGCVCLVRCAAAVAAALGSFSCLRGPLVSVVLGACF